MFGVFTFAFQAALHHGRFWEEAAAAVPYLRERTGKNRISRCNSCISEISLGIAQADEMYLCYVLSSSSSSLSSSGVLLHTSRVLFCCVIHYTCPFPIIAGSINVLSKFFFCVVDCEGIQIYISVFHTCPVTDIYTSRRLKNESTAHIKDHARERVFASFSNKFLPIHRTTHYPLTKERN